MKKIGDLNVNDGKGLYDNEGLCDSLLLDLNKLPRLLIDNQFVSCCSLIVSMTQKITNLKTGIRNDMDSMAVKIEELKKINDSLVEQMTGVPVEKEGASSD